MAARRLAWKSRRNARKSGRKNEYMHIVPDANIIIAEGYGDSSEFRLLLSTLEILQYRLYVPKLVIEEVVASFARTYDSRKQRVEDGLDWLSRHSGLELPSPIVTIDKRIRAGLFRNRLIERFNIPNCSIIGYPDTLHEALVKRATLRRKPFNPSGAGYRDSLIWETTLSLATESNNQVMLLSGNTNDFGDEEGGLHQDLIEDLVECGLPSDKVILVSSFNDFVNTYIDPIMSGRASE